MSNNIYQWIAKKLWLVTLCSLVAFALYISFGRYLASNIDKYSEIFLETINSQAPFTISAQSINGAWTGLTPELTIKNTKIVFKESYLSPLEADLVILSFSPIASLLARTPQFHEIKIYGAKARQEFPQKKGFFPELFS